MSIEENNPKAKPITETVSTIALLGRSEKMKLNLFAVLRHAVTMVGRRLKTYAFLSVTIILSFSFLLGYLLLTDSQQYNQNKEIFSLRPGDVSMFQNLFDNAGTGKQQMLYENLDRMENTIYFTAYEGNLGDMAIYYDPTLLGMDEAVVLHLQNLLAFFLPDGAWMDMLNSPMYSHFDHEIVWLDGRDDSFFHLNADEVILSEQVYRLLKLDQESEPIFQLRTQGWQLQGPGGLYTVEDLNTQLKVVGYAKGSSEVDYFKWDSWWETPAMYLSVKFLDWLDQNGWELYGMGGLLTKRHYFVHSDSPEQVVALGKTLGMNRVFSVYEAQNNALEAMQSQAGNKAIIACALLVLLGINLYSSFSNAMNERKYEIGVKRAVGASAWSIVRQFLYESLIVMLANVAISIALVVDVGVLYKIFMEWQSGFLDTYVLYLTPHSMVIFGACAVTLTVVFSLIFAYKSTQVEIVQYLKAE